LPSPALAQGHDWRLGTDVMFYDDTDNVTVFSPQVSVHRTIDEDGGEVFMRGAVDVYTSASIDVVAHASRGFDEVRYEGTIGASHAIGDVTPSISYRVSDEPDYSSHGGVIGAEARLGTPDSVLSASYGLTWDRVGRVDTPFDVFSENLWTHSGDVSFTQVLDSQTLLRSVYTLTVQNGYMEKPYRYVPLFAAPVQDTLDVEEVNRLRLDARPPEQVPDLRVRNALGLRLMRHIEGISGSLRGDYRFYVDTWEVMAHTAEIALQFPVVEALTLEMHTRVHYQSSASFWERAYVVSDATTLPKWRTGDKQLSEQLIVSGGARLELALPLDFKIYARADAVYTDFLDHLYIDDRFGILSQMGVRWMH